MGRNGEEHPAWPAARRADLEVAVARALGGTAEAEELLGAPKAAVRVLQGDEGWLGKPEGVAVPLGQRVGAASASRRSSAQRRRRRLWQRPQQLRQRLRPHSSVDLAVHSAARIFRCVLE